MATFAGQIYFSMICCIYFQVVLCWLIKEVHCCYKRLLTYMRLTTEVKKLHYQIAKTTELAFHIIFLKPQSIEI